MIIGHDDGRFPLGQRQERLDVHGLAWFLHKTKAIFARPVQIFFFLYHCWQNQTDTTGFFFFHHDQITNKLNGMNCLNEHSTNVSFSFSSFSFPFTVVGGGGGETSFLQSTLYLVYLITKNNSFLFEKFRASSIRKVSYNCVALLTLQFTCTVLLMHTWIQNHQGFIRVTITQVLTVNFRPDQRKEKASCQSSLTNLKFPWYQAANSQSILLLHRTIITDHRNSCGVHAQLCCLCRV